MPFNSKFAIVVLIARHIHVRMLCVVCAFMELIFINNKTESVPIKELAF